VEAKKFIFKNLRVEWWLSEVEESREEEWSEFYLAPLLE
jgi:hypothetical protein